MEKEELQLELKNLSEKLEGKGKEQIELAIKEFGENLETKMETSTKEAKEAAEKALKEAVDEIKTKMATDIKVVQDHADKLDAKLKKGGSKELEQKSFQTILAEQFEEKNDDIERFMRKEQSRVQLEIKAPADMSTANVTGGNRYGQIFAPRIIELPKRKMHMSQIIQGGSIGPGNSFTFMRQPLVDPIQPGGEGDPAPVAEGTTKAQFDEDLEESTVQVENIAGWMRVTNKALRNIPGFLSFLQSRIPERFERVKDAQILYGSGASPELKGILTAGNFTASESPLATPLIEKIIDDISLLEDTHERMADGVLLRPKDYYGFFKNKASGSGEYDLPEGVTIDNGMLRVFGIPAYASTAINDGDYVVGNWAEGAQLLTQEAMRVEFFREDRDNVIQNKVTVRVEGDYALPVYGHNYFIKGSTATS